MKIRALVFATCLFAVQLAVTTAFADEDGLELYTERVRPLLVSQCYECHGEEREESGLRLDSFEALMRGGEAGDAVVPGEPDQSLIVIAIEYEEEDFQMPPSGKLSDEEIDLLRRWIEAGAPHPDAPQKPRPVEPKVDPVKSEFWAFVAPAPDEKLPSLSRSDWLRTPVDSFVADQLDRAKLMPAKAADRLTLIRRVTLDLLGLPPTRQEVEAFLADQRPGAFERVVDRLLASPQYGERWGRHWLDVVRYADSNGLDENIAHGNAWKYRDYVIAALNSDKPYDEFVTEQLAGDLLESTDDQRRRERLTATGFLSLGPKVLAEGDQAKMEMDIIDEQIDTLGRAFLGMTFGCARCHDHKFDPITTEDYYALAGIFKSTRTMESLARIARWHENAVAEPERVAARAAHQKKIDKQKEAIAALVEKATQDLKQRLGPCADGQQKESQFTESQKQDLKRLRDELKKLQAALPELPTAMGVQEGEVADLRVHIRGNHLNLGKEVARGVPSVLRGGDEPTFGAQNSGRLELAQWLTGNDHPLVARVIVNRLWRWHFGRGLVDSPDNFGQLGGRPSNQPLLDWLSLELIQNQWSLKSLHRAVVLSETYRLSSNSDARSAELDPTNDLVGHWTVRRLEAEAIRDSVLAVSGLLDGSMGGSMLHVENREFFFDHTSKDETSYDSRRRSVYLPVVRNNLFDFFSMFDYSDASVPNGDRATSTVAPQALFMLNGEFMLAAAESLVESLGTVDSELEKIERLYWKVYSRPPSDTEVARAQSHLRRFEAKMRDLETRPEEISALAWSALGQVLLASNEFVYIR